MDRTDKYLTWFIRIWVGIAILVNLFSIFGLVIAGGSFWMALKSIWEVFNPWNLWNFFAELLLFSPAIGAAAWRRKRRAAN
jgi:hypothetical protein